MTQRRLRSTGICAAILALFTTVPVFAAQGSGTTPPHHGKLLYKDDFRNGLERWKLEAGKSDTVTVQGGALDIDVPEGATLWFRQKLQGPVLIEYQATAVSQGGANDRVSDLNCFWMATDPQHPGDIFATERHGVFSEYNSLLTYYVGLGGNGNTTTRFRRYIGSPTDRPLLPQNDLSARQFLLQANRKQTIRLLADENVIAFYRDNERIFSLSDDHPYTEGWFAIRTTKSHIRISHFRVYELREGKRP